MRDFRTAARPAGARIKMRKRKVIYPPAKTATRRQTPPGLVGGEPIRVRESLVSIDTNALNGRAGLKVGDKVRMGAPGSTPVKPRSSSDWPPAPSPRPSCAPSRRTRQVRRSTSSRSASRPQARRATRRARGPADRLGRRRRLPTALRRRSSAPNRTSMSIPWSWFVVLVHRRTSPAHR